MNKLKKITLIISLIFFTACGTEEHVNPDVGFDMWDYMTSDRNYEVEYDIYENNQKTDFFVETHRQFGSKYQRENKNGLTTILLQANQMIMNEPNDSINITRYLHVGDKKIFLSSKITECHLEKFHDSYKSRDSKFYNVLQINCNYKSGVNQKLYYGYNEGVIHIYENNNGKITEYTKVSEKEIE